MNARKITTKPRNDEVARETEAGARKPYASPRLTIYGSLEKLTKTGGRTTRDGGRGRRRH